MIATPGRLSDHVQTTPGFASSVMGGVGTVVLDEADRMLDPGFLPKVEQILRSMSRTDRQTVLVSATLPESVKYIARKYMRPERYVFVDVIAASRPDGMSEIEWQQARDRRPRISESIDHKVLVAPHALVPHAIVQELCGHAAARTAFKIIVFFPVKRQVTLMHALLRGVLEVCLGADARVLEIHSDMDQKKRNRSADDFRSSARGVLMGTDVIARGVDFPNVTLVVQVGLTDRDTYVHRVGRTGRAGKRGESTLILAEFEEMAMRDRLKGYGEKWFRVNDPNRSLAQNARVQAQRRLPPATNAGVVVRPDLVARLEEAGKSTPPKAFRQAHKAWLSFYGTESKSINVPKAQLEKEAREAFVALGEPADQAEQVGRVVDQKRPDTMGRFSGPRRRY